MKGRLHSEGESLEKSLDIAVLVATRMAIGMGTVLLGVRYEVRLGVCE